MVNKQQKEILLILACITGTLSQTYNLATEFHTNFFSDDDINGMATTNPWIISGANVPTYRYFTDCGGTRIFGGFKVLSGDNTNPAFVQKTWTNLPPHFAATISMKIYKIDSWTNDSFFIMVDGVSSQIYTWNSSTGTSDTCGQSNPLINSLNPQYNEFIQTYSQTILHSSSTLSLKLLSSLKSWTGSWGIRQLTITLSRCHLSCLTCTNASMCTGCDTANGLVLVGQFCECSAGGVRKLIQTGCPVNRCVTCISVACPAGYYPFNATACASCALACASCIGPGSLAPDCTSCNAQGYIDPGSGVCTICYGTCLTCTGVLQNQCTSCQYGSFLSSNRCISSCPTTFYGSEMLRACIACNSPCATCDGSTANHCISCLTGFYLYQTTCSNPCPFSMYGYNGLCIASCPLGTYPDTTVIPLCINCPSLCDTCDQTGICITCVSGAFFSPYDNLCHNPCPGAYYGDTSTYVCAACDPSCLTCFGPTSVQCNSCPPLTYLVYSTCYSTCPPHTYSLTCQMCHSSCLNCTGPASSQCTSCNKLEMLHLNTSQCLSSCFEGDIADNIEMTCITCPVGQTGYFKTCVPCYATCKSCRGIWYTDCLSCVSTPQHNSSLRYNFNMQLSKNSITYFPQAKTCIYSNTAVVYMPSATNSDSSFYTALLFMIWANLGLAFILQFLLKYKTNLMLTLQTMQLLSYLYYFNTPFSQSNQINLLTLYNAHPTALVQIHSILPKLSVLASTQSHPNIQSIFPKALLLSKTGVFISDTFYFHVFMLLLVVLFFILRISRNGCSLYQKVNPYLLAYGFRLLFTEFIFAFILFFSYIDLSNNIMKASLAILILDMIMIACSFFWKIRTELQPDHPHYALFYFNELGPRRESGQYLQLNEDQQKQRKSILPSLVFHISRIPLVITIMLFSNQPLTQSICLLIYSVFLFGVNLVIEHRRRIYRFMTLLSYFSLILSSMMMVLMCCQIDAAVLFDFSLLLVFSGFLLSTAAQILANHEFFFSVFSYYWSKFCGKPKD